MDIYPSLISANLLQLQHTISQLDPYCQGYHLDIMDDHFVPNLTWGPAFINAIRHATHHPLNVHLMVEKPESWINRLSLRAGDCFIFHHEAIPDYEAQKKLVDMVHQQAWLAGIAINPSTPVDAIDAILSVIDQVLIMSVQPGFSGQACIPEALKKIAPLLAKKKQLNKLFTVGVDGGVNEHIIPLLIKEHVDYIAVASSIFSYPDPVNALQQLQKRAHKE